MAFNFNWSPLIADTDRVRDMLTSALNKSPKPPIIVDDIIVNELNLGSTPPELEILEIGDLAEDRFRGIFKMSYTGDAYLTLKTRVQANPLNTYLSTKPSFASPQPLAASSSLTIPIQITLSDIRLSGFVILVFSKQKGITIVFRNDPLEKLKVSSTFDSIPFVRDYLQKTIENQLRVLFMEDLPAIIHRLSLQKFSPEHQLSDYQELRKSANGQRPIDPLASPSVQPVHDDGDVDSSYSLDSPTETYASFSQKNMVRLAALTESQRTLSLFTPSMRDTVYRAWASAANRDEASNGTSTPTRPITFSRLQSSIAAHSATASVASGAGSDATRPSLVSTSSTATVYSLGTGVSRSRPGKKRKNRIVNLRKRKGDRDDVSETVSLGSSYDDSATRSHSGSARSSILEASNTEATTAPSSNLKDGEVMTPPRSPPKKSVGFQQGKHHGAEGRSRPTTPRDPSQAPPAVRDPDRTPRASMVLPKKVAAEMRPTLNQFPSMQAFPSRSPSPELRRSSSIEARRDSSEINLQKLVSAFSESGSGGILEQAWMHKMATEIARKVQSERAKQRSWRPSSEDGIAEGSEAPPPAYVS